MVGFIVKKNFCDGWDNLLSLLVTNVVFLFTGIGLVMLNGLVSKNAILSAVVFVLSAIIVSIEIFAYGDTAAEIANFNGVSILDYFKAFPGVLKDASLFGLMVSVVIMLTSFAIRYYFFTANSIIGFLFGAAIVWFDLFFFLSIQWFIPIRSLMHNDFKKCLKKCFIVFFDNTWFTILVTLYNIVMLALSVVCIGFFPSIAGISIANTNSLRIRLYKYDYLEEHPELKTKRERSRIPWEELIYEDRQTLGPRKLRSFLFPWKED